MSNCSKIGGLILAAVLTLGAVGCAKDPPRPQPPQGKAASAWSTFSTVKITQNAKKDIPYEKQPAAVNISMMQGETEGSQLIVTAGDAAISEYGFEICALSDGNGHKIPTEDISVYHQKYLEVKNRTDDLNTDFSAGDFVPDMLLPMEIAKRYGENKISVGENQGITIEVTTNDETVPGVYTGEFVLDLDGEKYAVPVSVEVWGFGYKDRRPFQSSFLLYRNTLIRGEYEASDELVDRYVDFLLDYNVNTYVIKDGYDVNAEVENMVRLYENKNYSSFAIPVFMSAGYKANGTQAQTIVDYILEVAKISTTEKPYIENVYVYPSYFDEADVYSDKLADVQNVFRRGGEWDKTLEKAAAALKNTSEYAKFDDAFKLRVEKAVANVPAVLTNVTFQRDWVESMYVTFCPYLNMLGDDAQLQQYREQADTYNNGDLWAYTCVGPTYPNPTFHMDDYNLGTRLSGWMAKKFGLNGYLYWAVNMYQAVNEDNWRDVNVYETAERAGYCAGDGFLVYPGAYYGSEYPFASVRLAAWRDAMDDYDMLCVYESLLREKTTEYGVSVNFDEYVNDLYDELFAGTSYYTDDSLVVGARRELARRILALQSEDGIFVRPKRGGVDVYSVKNDLTINGEKATAVAVGSGFVYSVSNEGNQAKIISVEAKSGTYTFGVNAAGSVVSFTDDKGNAMVTEGSSVSYSGGLANVKIVSVYRSEDQTIDGATQRFMPYVQFALQGGMKGASAVCFTVNNTGEYALNFTLRLIRKDGVAVTAGTGYVKAGGSRDFRIDLDSRIFTDDVLSLVEGVRIAFKNVNDQATKLEPDREFSVGDVWYEIR